MELLTGILPLPFIGYAVGLLFHQVARYLEWDTAKDGTAWSWKRTLSGTISAAFLYGLIEAGLVKVLPDGVGFWPWAAIGYAADSASAHVWKVARGLIEKKAGA